MKNIMNLSNGYQAVIAYDPEIEMFRGELINVNGGADFYASNLEELRREGEISLKVFLEACAEKGYEPRKKVSGKFMLRLDPDLYAKASTVAASMGISLNNFIKEAIVRSVAENS